MMAEAVPYTKAQAVADAIWLQGGISYEAALKAAQALLADQANLPAASR